MIYPIPSTPHGCPGATMAQPASVELWNTSSLVGLIPGSTRKVWLTRWIPALVKTKAMRKIGKSWAGRRADIERWLLTGAVGA